MVVAMRTILQHIRGNVVAYLALFVALGGTSYAAAKLPANSVTSRQIKNGSVTRADLAKSARPLTRARMAEAITQVVTDPATGINVTLHAQDGAQGPQGDPGPQGPAGATGPAGPPSTPVVTLRTATASVSPSATGSAVASCDAGQKVIGGGATMPGDSGSSGTAGAILTSSPTDDGLGWAVQMTNRGAEAHTMTVIAVCVVTS